VQYLPPLLKHEPRYYRQHMWLMHDGVLHHFLHAVKQHLNRTFGQQCTGRGGQVDYSARSHFNPMDFRLCGTSMGCHKRVSSQQKTKKQQQSACGRLRCYKTENFQEQYRLPEVDYVVTKWRIYSNRRDC
jgi:hypothetical protein